MTSNFDWSMLPITPVDVLAPILISGHEVRVRADGFSLEGEEVVLSLLLGFRPGVLYDIAQISASLVQMLYDHPVALFGVEESAKGGLAPGAVLVRELPGKEVRQFVVPIVLPDGTRGTFSVKAHEYRIEWGFVWFYFRLQGEPGAILDIASVPAEIVSSVAKDEL